jgi:SAM-dependent methyltransferase
MAKKLNLGSSGRKKEGYINVDWLSLVKPDIEHNLNIFPYPFTDSEFDRIEADHIIEHLDRPFEVMKEIHRILAPGGELIIKVPHFSRAMSHPEHFHGFDVTFPNYFNKKFIDIGYFGIDLEIVSVRLKWSAFPHIVKDMGFSSIILVGIEIADSVFSFFANLSPSFCSRLWCFWVGGFEQIEFIFIKSKTH